MLLLGDLNAKIGRVMIEGVTGKYGVGDKNENGDMLFDLCAEKGLVIGSILFEHKDIYKYTWAEDGERGGRSMLDYVIVDERLRKGLEDVRVRRGVGAWNVRSYDGRREDKSWESEEGERLSAC